MSKENLMNLLKASTNDEQLLKAMLACKSSDELKVFAGKKGYEISDLSNDEIVRAVKFATGDDELTEEQIQEVAGGFLSTDPRVTFKEKYKAAKASAGFTATDDLWK